MDQAQLIGMLGLILAALWRSIGLLLKDDKSTQSSGEVTAAGNEELRMLIYAQRSRLNELETMVEAQDNILRGREVYIDTLERLQSENLLTINNLKQELEKLKNSQD